MKNLIRTFVAAFVLILGGVSQSMAQPGGGGRGPKLPTDKEIVEMVNTLDEKIDMTDSQQAEVLELYQAHFSEMEEMMSEGRPNREQMQEKKEAFSSSVKAQLNEKQQLLFEEFMKSQRPQKGGRR